MAPPLEGRYVCFAVAVGAPQSGGSAVALELEWSLPPLDNEAGIRVRRPLHAQVSLSRSCRALRVACRHDAKVESHLTERQAMCCLVGVFLERQNGPPIRQIGRR